MSRFTVISAPAPYATPAVRLNRHRDAVRVLEAQGEGVPKRSEFGHGWGVMLAGNIAIGGAAEALDNMNGPIQGFFGSRLADALLDAVPEAQPLAQSFADSREHMTNFRRNNPVI